MHQYSAAAFPSHSCVYQVVWQGHTANNFPRALLHTVNTHLGQCTLSVCVQVTPQQLVSLCQVQKAVWLWAARQPHSSS